MRMGLQIFKHFLCVFLADGLLYTGFTRTFTDLLPNAISITSTSLYLSTGSGYFVIEHDTPLSACFVGYGSSFDDSGHFLNTYLISYVCPFLIRAL